MRDYKSSGGFSLRKRRRFPRGLILVAVLIIIIIAALGYGFTEYMANPTVTISAKPSSGRTVIPLPIPGQQTAPAAND